MFGQHRWRMANLLLLVSPLSILLFGLAQLSLSYWHPGENKNFLDGCRHVYLDMGTNTGVQIRKLYQPHLFPNASVLPIFDKFFGPSAKRDPKSICSVGFEPNVLHNEALIQLENQYQLCGWRVYINLATGVGMEEKKDVAYAHKKVWQGGGGWAMSDSLGVMGRFSDGGQYTSDIVKGTLSKVRQIRIADFIKGVVATRRLEGSLESKTQHPPSVVMKLDVEGRELDVIPDLVMSGALQHIDHLHVDWTRDEWTNRTLVDQLSEAMSVLSRMSQERGLLHTTEVIGLEDESYLYYNGPLPQCME